MASILTNNGAMVALQTMRGINKGMDTTQSQISTGLKVGSAKDNAATWAISKVMESDVAGFKAIKESLALGSSTVNVARNAAETTTTLLTEIKEKVVQAQEQNVDRGKIQEDITQLRDQISSVINAAQFNGLNLVNNSFGGPEVEVLSSLDRAGAGVTASSIDVATANFTTDAGATPPTGVLADPGTDWTVNGDGNIASSVVADAATVGMTVDAANANNLAAGSEIVMTIGDQQVTYTVSEADAALAEGVTRNTVIAAAMRGAIDGLGIENLDVALDATATNQLNITNNTGDDLAMTFEVRAEGAGILAGLDGINVESETGPALANRIADVERMIQGSIDAAASFGSVQKRIEIQSEFVGNLMDSLKSGIGSLVDADMEETSARLQALQVQQQLGIQALSIANQQPQNILSLFR